MYVEFKGASVGETELLKLMNELADPPESLQAELELSRPGAVTIRVRIHDGTVERSRIAEAS
jgi:hypothetical protein